MFVVNRVSNGVLFILICFVLCEFGCKRHSTAAPASGSSKAVKVKNRHLSKSKRGLKGQKKTAKTLSPSSLMNFQIHPINDKLKPHAKIASFIRPFQSKLKKRMARVIGHSRQTLRRNRPNSSLGNLVADISLARLQKTGAKVDIFAVNFGGLRNDLPSGPVTVGNIFEVLPFENALVWVKLSGEHLLRILNTIAKRKGEPIAGISMVIDTQTKKAIHVRVKGKSLQLRKIYHFGTIDYLAKTGYLKPHLKGLQLHMTGLLLRDAVLWGMKQKRFLKNAKKDLRISFSAGSKK